MATPAGARRGTALRAREVKVVLIGDAGVGKTSMALRYVTNQFRDKVESTIGASFLSKTTLIDDKPFKFQIWDTAGQEKYHSLTPMYYRGAAICILAYAIDSRRSFELLENWINELKANGKAEVVIGVAATKSDREEYREVPAAEGEEFAKKHGGHFMETSAKEDSGVTDLFAVLARSLPQLDMDPALTGGSNGGMTLASLTAPPQKKKCC
mmetsp:Transcript_33534/g.85808  ORF Transcript_33534/g.85808 Transcript_33534/m.85808 type:complete len:211 (+) Transcript_33534:196-828(+)